MVRPAHVFPEGTAFPSILSGKRWSIWTGNRFRPRPVPAPGPYNQREIKGLLTKSKAYKGWYTRYYQEKGL